MPMLPTDAKERKKIPLWSGLFKYFPLTLIEVAKLSYVGNEQHNSGQPLHWAREKSSDHEDTLLRHLMEKGTVDSDGVRHIIKAVWRSMAAAELELEAAQKEAHLENGPKITVNLGRASDPIPSPAPAKVFYSFTRKNSEE